MSADGLDFILRTRPMTEAEQAELNAGDDWCYRCGNPATPGYETHNGEPVCRACCRELQHAQRAQHSPLEVKDGEGNLVETICPDCSDEVSEHWDNEDGTVVIGAGVAWPCARAKDA